MRTPRLTLLVTAALATSVVVSAKDLGFDGSAAAIRAVVAGKQCVGSDVLAFGDKAPGSAGTFERVGQPAGAYSVGYGTILIRRGEEVHGHVASVSTHDRMLYLSTSAYRCGD